MPSIKILFNFSSPYVSNFENKILLNDVFEDACVNRQIDPDEHELIHNRKKVDLSSPFDHSGLVNNAEVDCEKIESKLSPNVRVAFKCDDGSRLNWTGNPSTTILEILKDISTENKKVTKYFDVKSEEMQPEVVFFSKQVIGITCLQSINLLRFGLRFGSGILNLNLKKISSGELKIHQDCLLSKLNQLKNIKGLPKEILEEVKVVQPKVFDKPQENKEMINNPLSVFSSAQTTSMFDKAPAASNSAAIDPNTEKEKSLGEYLGISLETNRVATIGYNSNEFANFKFPTESCGKDLTGRDGGEVNSIQNVQPCDRQIHILHRNKRGDFKPEEEDDSVFNFTEEDLRLLLKSLKEQMNADGFSKRTVTDSYVHYKRCVIHFYIEGQEEVIIVQACFKPQEKVNALYEFASKLIDNLPKSFVLYTTPPKTKLKNKEDSLIEAKLVPMTQIRLSVGTSVLFTPIFNKNIDAKFSQEEANNVIRKWLSDKEEDTRSEKRVNSSSSKANPVPKWFKMS